MDGLWKECFEGRAWQNYSVTKLIAEQLLLVLRIYVQLFVKTKDTNQYVHKI